MGEGYRQRSSYFQIAFRAFHLNELLKFILVPISLNDPLISLNDRAHSGDLLVGRLSCRCQA
jgi:hypothetical protein